MANRTFSVKIEGALDGCGARIAGKNVPMGPTGGDTFENQDPVVRDVEDTVKIEIFVNGQTNTDWKASVQDETADDEVYKGKGSVGDLDPQHPETPADPLRSKRITTKTLKPLN